MKINFIRNSYVRFYKAHKKEIDAAIQRCLTRGDLIMAGEVEKFEKNFAKFCKRKYCLSTASGTDALKLVGQVRKFAPVGHYRYRLPKEIIDIENGIPLVTYMNSVQEPTEHTVFVEDACQAAGQPLHGIVSCFSFYPAKILGGLGRGGALVTNHKEIYENLKKIRDDKWNNIWLEEIHAAFLNVKLKHLTKLVQRRKEIAKMYNDGLPKLMIYDERCVQNYLVLVENVSAFVKFMKQKGIEVIPDKSDFYEWSPPNAVRIPIYAELKDNEVNYIIKSVKQFYAKR